MISRLRAHLTYANVMASIAVFVALGGLGYAALRLPAGSVGTRQLRRGAVTLNRISPSAIRAVSGARAYGLVSREGVLDSRASRNVVKVTPTGVSDYCIQLKRGIDASRIRVVAMLDVTKSATGGQLDAESASEAGCPAGAPPNSQTGVYSEKLVVGFDSSSVPRLEAQPVRQGFFFVAP